MQIPTYQSTNGIKVGNTPELNLSSVKASEKEQGNLSQAIKNVGENFAEVEAARGKVRDFRQTNEAQAYAFEKINSIKALADEDVDFDPTRYEEEINKVGQEAAKTITSPLAKEEFMANFQRQATTTSWGIKNLFRTRELEASKAAIEYNRQQLVNSYAGMSHAEQITAVANFKKSLIGGVKAGIYNQGTAQQIDLKFQSDVQKSVVDNDIVANPEMALIELKKGATKYGNRADGTEKGPGFLGELKRPDGKVSTELSIGVTLDSKETEIPTLVPTLTQKEVDYLLEGNKPTKEIVDKAVEHAKERMDQGLSPFAENDKGKYPNITEQFRTDSIEKAIAYDKKYKAEAEAKQKELINTNEDNIVTRMIDPQKPKPTEGEIVTMMNSGNPEEKISPRFAKAVIENIRSAKKYKPDDKGTEFNSIISDMIDPKKDPKETLIKIMSANTSGKISDDDFNNLSIFAQSITKKELDNALPKQKHLWGLISWGTDVNLRPVAKMQMLKYYLKQVNNNVAPEVAIKDAMKQAIIITHPQASTYSEKGQKLIDVSGATKKIFPTYELSDDTGDAD